MESSKLLLVSSVWDVVFTVFTSLAVLEMKMLLKEVYSSYRTRVAREMKGLMEPDDQIIASRPKGQQCLLVFEKLT